MAYKKAAVRHARMAREAREQMEQDDRARVADVVAEFAGDTARMAEEIELTRSAMHGNQSKVIVLEQQQSPELGFADRVAFSSIAWNTGSSLPGELEMT